jgi:hypothetical protein
MVEHLALRDQDRITNDTREKQALPCREEGISAYNEIPVLLLMLKGYMM